MQKITPFLWFNNNAEEAINFYISIFKNSKAVSISRFGQGGPGADGKFVMGTFHLDGQDFFALDGGPMYQFTPAISLYINCETQAEVDEFWEKLSEGGAKSQCGWLTDKFGLTWQVVPSALPRLMMDKDPAKAKRVTDAMMKMGKIDIKTLQDAYDNK